MLLLREHRQGLDCIRARSCTHSSPGTEETPFIARSLARSLLAHMALLLFCGLAATGSSSVSVWQISGQSALDGRCVSDQDLLRPWSLFVQNCFLYRRRKHSSQAAGAQWNILVMDTPLSSSSHTPKGMMRTLSALPLFVYFSCLYSQLFHEEMWSRSGLNRANFFWRIRVILEISECNLHHWIKQWCRSMRAVNTKALLFCFYKSNWIKWQSQLKHPELITVPAVSFVCFSARVKG